MINGIFDDIFGPNGKHGTNPDPKTCTPNQARAVLYAQLMHLSRAMKAYVELLEKNKPTRRP